jgi:uroporphyrinogen decarboxylase
MTILFKFVSIDTPRDFIGIFPNSIIEMSSVDLSESIFLKALRGEKTERTPIWLMRQAGRYQKSYREIREKVDFLTLCKTSELASQVTVQAVDDLGVDAGIIFADILLPLECLGSGLRFAKGDGPVLDNPVRLASDIERLHSFDVQEGLGYVFESVRLFVRERGNVPLIGFAGAPFTLASYLIEGGSSRHFERTKQFIYREPQAFNRLMALLAAMTVDYLVGQAKAGASCLMLFDSWVGCLSRQDFQSHVLPHSVAIFSALREQLPTLPNIYFGTSTGTILDLMSQAGSTALGVDWRMQLSTARDIIGADRPVMGNLDPCLLLGPQDELKRQAKLILDDVGRKPGHIFNLGHGILQHTPENNVRALVECVHEYSESIVNVR